LALTAFLAVSSTSFSPNPHPLKPATINTATKKRLMVFSPSYLSFIVNHTLDKTKRKEKKFQKFGEKKNILLRLNLEIIDDRMK
jgi:hypothetical protein